MSCTKVAHAVRGMATYCVNIPRSVGYSRCAGMHAT